MLNMRTLLAGLFLFSVALPVFSAGCAERPGTKKEETKDDKAKDAKAKDDKAKDDKAKDDKTKAKPE